MKHNVLIAIAVSTVMIAGGLYASSNLRSAPKKTATSLTTAATPESRNQLRVIALKSLSTAINNYIADKGSLPIKISTVPKAICSGISATCAKAKLVDLNFLSATGTYISSIPNDPVGVHTRYSTGFLIATDPSTGKIVISAPNAELGAVLSASTR